MTSLKRIKDVFALGQFGMVLAKAEGNAEITRSLEKFGYSSVIMDQGKEYLEIARKMYKENVGKKYEYTYIQAAFEKKKLEIDHRYRDHRPHCLNRDASDECDASDNWHSGNVWLFCQKVSGLLRYFHTSAY